MCNKKGFTLIELLATIVVIAVVSLIAVPVVISVIEKADLASFKRSAENIKKISKNYYANNSLEYQEFDNIYFDCNNNECINNFGDVEHKNLGASGSMGNGYVKIYAKGEIEFLLSNGKYCAEKNIANDEIKYYKGTCEEIVIDLDKIKINNIKTFSTTSTITASVDVTAGQSGVSRYEFYIDNKLDETVENTNTSYTHTYTKVSGKNHKIKVKVYNGTYGKPNYDESIGMDEKEIDASLSDFGTITIKPSTTEWASSKTYTISGKTEGNIGEVLEYQIVNNGNGERKDDNRWQTITSPTTISINEMATPEKPISIYARLRENDYTSNEVNHTETKIDITAPILTLGSATVTTKSMVIPITANVDNESGVNSTTCVYGTSTSYGSTGTISNNKCTISDLKNNTTYYYKVTTTNNAGLSTSKTGSNQTGEFGAITIITSSTAWKSSKTYTISGTTTGAKLQYKVISGTTVKQDWTDYISTITVDWASTTTNPTYIYARFYDGHNTSNETSLMETKIDITAPILTLGSATVTTKSMVIPITANVDNESGINSTTCVYGTSTSYGSAGTISGNSCVINNISNNTTYYYKVTTTNNAGLSTSKTGNGTSGQTSIVFTTSQSPTNTTYAKTKTVTVTYTSSNVTNPTYYIKTTVATTSTIDGYSCGTGTDPGTCNTTATKSYGANTWYKVTGNPAVTFKANGTIYARVNDGAIYSSAETLSVTKIDTTLPTVSYSVAGGTYDSYQTIRITPSDTNYDYMAVQVYKNEALVYTNKIDAKSTSKTTASYYDVKLDDEGTWTIYTVVYDKAGNKQNQNPNNGKWYYQTYNIDSAKYVLTVKQTGGTPINVNIMIDNVSMSNSSFAPSTIKTFEVKANSAVQIKLAKYTLSDQCVAGEHPKAGTLYGKIYSNPSNINVDGTSYTTNPYTFTMPKKDITVIVGGQTDGSCTPDAKEACRFSCYTSAISSCENVTPSEAQTSCMNGYTESCYKNC